MTLTRAAEGSAIQPPAIPASRSPPLPGAALRLAASCSPTAETRKTGVAVSNMMEAIEAASDAVLPVATERPLPVELPSSSFSHFMVLYRASLPAGLAAGRLLRMEVPASDGTTVAVRIKMPVVAGMHHAVSRPQSGVLASRVRAVRLVLSC